MTRLSEPIKSNSITTASKLTGGRFANTFPGSKNNASESTLPAMWAPRVRRMVLGDNDVQPTPEQLEQMQEFVRQAMRDGAVGVSTSLEYAPAPYAKTDELIALAAEA